MIRLGDLSIYPLPQHLLQTPALSEVFQILSTNEDRVGRTFVSTVEGKKCPFYGSQWHPEKVNDDGQEKCDLSIDPWMYLTYLSVHQWTDIFTFLPTYPHT